MRIDIPTNVVVQSVNVFSLLSHDRGCVRIKTTKYFQDDIVIFQSIFSLTLFNFQQSVTLFKKFAT